MLITLHFCSLGTNSFHVKAKSERSAARVVVRTSNMKISRLRLADYIKTLHQKACCTCTRAARLFFFIQPIKSLICGVVVDVALVKS